MTRSMNRSQLDSAALLRRMAPRSLSRQHCGDLRRSGPPTKTGAGTSKSNHASFSEPISEPS